MKVYSENSIKSENKNRSEKKQAKPYIKLQCFSITSIVLIFFIILIIVLVVA